MYSTTARTNVAVRTVGYFESTQATAGTWATAASVLQLMGPGVRRTGERVQHTYFQTSTLATGTTVFPDDNTIPQNTEGDQYMSLAITPTSAINRLLIEVSLFGSSGVNVQQYAALFQDAVANALTASKAAQSNTLTSTMHRLLWEMAAGTVASTTFKLRAGAGSAGTFTFCGQAGGNWFGGVTNSFIKIEEVMV
jgi:hypothetical protein